MSPFFTVFFYLKASLSRVMGFSRNFLLNFLSHFRPFLEHSNKKISHKKLSVNLIPSIFELYLNLLNVTTLMAAGWNVYCIEFMSTNPSVLLNWLDPRALMSSGHMCKSKGGCQKKQIFWEFFPNRQNPSNTPFWEFRFTLSDLPNTVVAKNMAFLPSPLPNYIPYFTTTRSITFHSAW